jgi:hypothetical protein
MAVWFGDRLRVLRQAFRKGAGLGSALADMRPIHSGGMYIPAPACDQPAARAGDGRPTGGRKAYCGIAHPTRMMLL